MFSELREQQISRGKEIMGSWSRVSEDVSPDVKDQIAKLYIQHVLNLGEEKAQRFLEMSRDSRYIRELWNEVGEAQSGITDDGDGVKEFWTLLKKLAPEFLPDEGDEKLFAESATANEVCTLMWRLNRIENQDNFSHVVYDLEVNAHAYK